MTRKEAGLKLKRILSTCTVEQAQDVNDLVEIGAGCIPPPDGTIFSGPAEMPNERRHAFLNLIDAVYECDGDSGAMEWRPIHAGNWEHVIATLVIEEDWDKLHEAAEDLRREETEEQRQARLEMRRAIH